MATVADELLIISKEHGGILRPVDVVEYAKNPDTALHSKFTWDDTVAAHEYRLWQARQVIRVSVHYLKAAKRNTKVFVSLKTDRHQAGGGYRTTVNVMKSPELRDQLLNEALEELERIKDKYQHLSELASVFAELDRVKALKQAKVAIR